MNKKQLILACLFLTGCVSASGRLTNGKGYAEGKFTIPFDFLTEQKKEFTTELGVVYVGMPKEDLKKVGFTEYTQKDYLKDGNEEWIVFSNWMTKEPNDKITFYLVDRKVKGWK